MSKDEISTILSPRTTRYGRTLKKPAYLSPEPTLSSSRAVRKTKPSTVPTRSPSNKLHRKRRDKRPRRPRSTDDTKRTVTFSSTAAVHGTDVDTSDDCASESEPTNDENSSTATPKLSLHQESESSDQQYRTILHETFRRLRFLDDDYDRLDHGERLLLAEYWRLRTEEVCLRNALRKSKESGKERRMRRMREGEEEVVRRLEAALFADDDGDSDSDSDSCGEGSFMGENGGLDGSIGLERIDGDLLLDGDGGGGEGDYLTMDM